MFLKGRHLNISKRSGEILWTSLMDVQQTSFGKFQRECAIDHESFLEIPQVTELPRDGSQTFINSMIGTVWK